MNCKNVQNLLSAYLDAELSGSEMMRMNRHLSDCRECQREETELRMLKDLLTSTPLVEPPADFEDRLCGAIFSPQKSETARWVGSWPFVSGVALITAALTLFVINHLQTEQAVSGQSRPANVVARELQRDQTLTSSDPYFDSTPMVAPANYDGK